MWPHSERSWTGPFITCTDTQAHGTAGYSAGMWLCYRMQQTKIRIKGYCCHLFLIFSSKTRLEKEHTHFTLFWMHLSKDTMQLRRNLPKLTLVFVFLMMHLTAVWAPIMLSTLVSSYSKGGDIMLKCFFPEVVH